MALHWRPVGPEPARTYWQRRAAVALVLLVPLTLLVDAVGGDEPEQRLAQEPAPSTSALPSASAVPSAAASGSPQATPVPSPTPPPAACSPAALEVAATTAESSYAVGATPRLELRITNTGSVPCTADVGQGAVELLVVSGSDRIWSSDDCAPGGGSRVVALAPGRPEVSRVTWPGTRSRPGCAGDRAAAQPGTYRVVGRVGALRVPGRAFRLEG